jgi:hypothetical protein
MRSQQNVVPSSSMKRGAYVKLKRRWAEAIGVVWDIH